MSKRRNKRPVRKVIAILVDGKTEQWYLESLRAVERPVAITIRPKLPKKKTLPELYRRAEALARDAHEVVLLLDMDAHLSDAKRAETSAKLLRTFAQKRQKLEAANITFIVNHPCLERWYLLHFEDSRRAYNRQTPLIDHLKRHLPDYEKKESYYKRQSGSLYEDLKEQLPAAIARSKAMPHFDVEQPDCAVCEMYRLFELLSRFNQ